MQPIALLDLASRKVAWLATREAAVATNVANANTPGYKAKDVVPFADQLARTNLDVVSTNAGHLSLSETAGDSNLVTIEDADAADITESGNTVGVEGEMTKSGQINREYALTTNLVKSFHAMLMASLKS